eukprot:TRINITY_DN1823_c1_g1_i11.p2 TRINITY_DN1823_c1_g1~~TRINITY_DN1823_c1_g1_i11.p2  ORF type:complete len:219 (-),score=-9.71 TRINITY_DN1823_c1_g1_i11:1156-1812(-)
MLSQNDTISQFSRLFFSYTSMYFQMSISQFHFFDLFKFQNQQNFVFNMCNTIQRIQLHSNSIFKITHFSFNAKSHFFQSIDFQKPIFLFFLFSKRFQTNFRSYNSQTINSISQFTTKSYQNQIIDSSQFLGFILKCAALQGQVAGFAAFTSLPDGKNSLVEFCFYFQVQGIILISEPGSTYNPRLWNMAAYEDVFKPIHFFRNFQSQKVALSNFQANG